MPNDSDPEADASKDALARALSKSLIKYRRTIHVLAELTRPSASHQVLETLGADDAVLNAARKEPGLMNIQIAWSVWQSFASGSTQSMIEYLDTQTIEDASCIFGVGKAAKRKLLTLLLDELGRGNA